MLETSQTKFLDLLVGCMFPFSLTSSCSDIRKRFIPKNTSGGGGTGPTGAAGAAVGAGAAGATPSTKLFFSVRRSVFSIQSRPAPLTQKPCMNELQICFQHC